MVIGQRIKHYRELNQLTQSQLGEMIGVDQRAISSYETGERTPPLNRLPKLAECLDVTVYELLADGILEPA